MLNFLVSSLGVKKRIILDKRFIVEQVKYGIIRVLKECHTDCSKERYIQLMTDIFTHS